MGFEIKGSGCGVHGFGLGAHGLGLGFWGSGFIVWGLGLGFRVRRLLFSVVFLGLELCFGVRVFVLGFGV